MGAALRAASRLGTRGRPGGSARGLPGEHHDLRRIAFGLALRSRGWRIAYLGGDTPVETVLETSRELDPSLVVLNAVTAERVLPIAQELEALAGRHRLAIGGAAARGNRLEADGVLALSGDPVYEAERVTALVAGGAEPGR